MKSRKEDFKSIGKSSKQLLQRRRDEFSLKIKEARRKKLMHKRKFLSEDAASVEITEQQLQEQIEKLENKKTSDTICESLAFIAKSLSTTENEQWIIRKLYNEAYIFFKLKKFLQSPNERVVMETLHLLVNLAACINLNNDEVDDGDVEQAGELNNDNDGMDDDDNVDKPLLSIEQLVEKQCMAFVVDVIPYLSSSVTSYLELSCWFLANVAANGQVEAQTLVENGCVAPLLTLLRGNDVDERVLRAALFALSNVVKFAGSGGLAEQLIGDQVPRGCVTLLADSNRAMPLRAEAAWLLCNVCDWSNLKHNNDLAGMLIALFSQLQLAAVFDTIQAPSPLVIPLVRVWISVCSLLSFVPVSLKWNATSSSLQTLALWLSQLLSNPTTNDTKLKEISYLLSIITFHTDLIKVKKKFFYLFFFVLFLKAVCLLFFSL